MDKVIKIVIEAHPTEIKYTVRVNGKAIDTFKQEFVAKSHAESIREGFLAVGMYAEIERVCEA